MFSLFCFVHFLYLCFCATLLPPKLLAAGSPGANSFGGLMVVVVFDYILFSSKVSLPSLGAGGNAL